MPTQNPGEPYYRISIDEAAEMQASGDSVVVDVRALNEYAEGHVKGALFIHVDTLLGRIDELPQDKNLLFICAIGVRSDWPPKWQPQWASTQSASTTSKQAPPHGSRRASPPATAQTNNSPIQPYCPFC